MHVAQLQCSVTNHAVTESSLRLLCLSLEQCCCVFFSTGNKDCIRIVIFLSSKFANMRTGYTFLVAVNPSGCCRLHEYNRELLAAPFSAAWRSLYQEGVKYFLLHQQFLSGHPNQPVEVISAMARIWSLTGFPLVNIANQCFLSSCSHHCQKLQQLLLQLKQAFPPSATWMPCSRWHLPRMCALDDSMVGPSQACWCLGYCGSWKWWTF